MLGRIPEGALATESISQNPDVLGGEDDVRRQDDWNLMAFDLGRHAAVLGEMVSGNQIDRIMAAEGFQDLVGFRIECAVRAALADETWRANSASDRG